jgi:chromosome segregation ATPase
MDISSSTNLTNRHVMDLLGLAKDRLKLRESEMGKLNKEKEQKRAHLKEAEEKINQLQNDLLKFKKESNQFLNSGGIIPKNFIPHRDTEIKVFRSKISMAIKSKEKIILEIKTLDEKISKVQLQINTEAKKEKKFEYFQGLHDN